MSTAVYLCGSWSVTDPKWTSLLAQGFNKNENERYVKLKTPSDIPSVEVTGITDGGLKLAKFSWKYKNLPQEIQPFACAGGTGSATFRLYDDGWRVGQVLTDPPVHLQ